MGYKLISQIVLIIASVVIIFSFIKPSFEKIKTTQDEMFQYKDTIAKATQFNTLLQELIASRDSVSLEDMRTLEGFVPSKIDELQIMKDIETIFAINEVPIVSLTASLVVSPQIDVNFEGEVVTKTGAPETSYQDFDIEFDTTYPKMKNILRYIEANAALLEVIDFQFGTLDKSASGGDGVAGPESDAHNFKLKLRAYGLVESKN